MTEKFAGKVVIVTGVASGIGAAISLELLRQGAEVRKSMMLNHGAFSVPSGEQL